MSLHHKLRNVLIKIIQGRCCVMQVREGALFYLTGFWNLLSCAASVCLIVAGVSHFLGWMVGVRTVGSLGCVRYDHGAGIAHQNHQKRFVFGR